MRPVRFVALSEDGQALVLADEVGRLLALPIDERIAAVLHAEPRCAAAHRGPRRAVDPTPSLSPRDIQARIRSGESAEDVARIAGVPGRPGAALRRPGAPGAGHARPARPAHPAEGRREGHARWPRWSTAGWPSTASTPRRSPGTRTGATTAPGGSSPPGRPARPPRRPSGISTRLRQQVTPHDDMAQYLCAERPTPILGQEPAPERGGHALPGPSRGEPSRGGHGLPAASEQARPRPGPDPGRPGRPARRRWTVRSAAPRAGVSTRAPRPRWPAPTRPVSGPSAVAPPRCSAVGRVPPSTTTRTRPRRSRPCRRWRCCGRAARAPAAAAGGESTDAKGKPRKRLPSWDDVLFGSGPAARESS